MIIFVFLGCKNKSPEGELRVQIPTSLRAEPSEKSREIVALVQDQQLADLGEVSKSESRLRLRDALFQTPWIKVQTAENKSGWVFAGAVTPPGNHRDWLLQKRLECYFGKSLAARRNALLEKTGSLNTETDLAAVWRESAALRDTFLYLLTRRAEQGFQPQFEWLAEALPGFVFQKMPEGVAPGLFADFKYWQQKALATTGKQDDALMQTCLTAFPVDSIESAFPAWKFQITETESASQLGTGIHLIILQQIDAALKQGNLFAPELTALKEQVLEDIFGKNQRYWQPPARILKALAAMQSNPPRCLTPDELEQLSIRQQMFIDPDANGIITDLRSGQYH